MGSFQYLTNIGRGIVKARAPSRGKNKNGAYIGMPKDWSGKTVKISLASCLKCGAAEIQERGWKVKDGKKLKQAVCKKCGKFFTYEPLIRKVVGTTSFMVSAPDEWIGKNVIIELLETPRA